MPVDFSALVLRPAMDTFARVCTFYPQASQPNTIDTDHPYGVPYKNRGIFTTTAFDVPMQDGMIFSDQKTELGIKLNDFVIPPARDDRVVVDGAGYFKISDADIDGQGGMKLALRRTSPDENLPALP